MKSFEVRLLNMGMNGWKIRWGKAAGSVSEQRPVGQKRVGSHIKGFSKEAATAESAKQNK